jgi:Family of unknown function (DUF6665)
MIGLEFEIAQEQAESLGVAGRKLQASIERYRAAVRRRHASEREALLNEIASRAWGLMVQRELIGFKQDNVRWMLDNFDLPAAALKQLGWPGSVSCGPKES